MNTEPIFWKNLKENLNIDHRNNKKRGISGEIPVEKKNLEKITRGSTAKIPQ